MLNCTLVICSIAVLALALVSGCNRQQEPVHPPLDVKSSHGTRKVSSLAVPESVAGKWQSVSIAILDKPTASQKTYTVPIGGSYTVPSGKMTIEVEAFLPAFIMQGTTITSSSNRLTNPAAKVRISEKGSTIFQGWLFSMHQNTHTQVHPTYGFSLVEAKPAAPAKKKR